jgi:hypothetical protein
VTIIECSEEIMDCLAIRSLSAAASIRRIAFTQAQIQRAVKGAEAAGLKIKRLTIRPDGSIEIDTGEPEVKEPIQGAGWDDV